MTRPDIGFPPIKGLEIITLNLNIKVSLSGFLSLCICTACPSSEYDIK